MPAKSLFCLKHGASGQHPVGAGLVHGEALEEPQELPALDLDGGPAAERPGKVPSQGLTYHMHQAPSSKRTILHLRQSLDTKQ